MKDSNKNLNNSVIGMRRGGQANSLAEGGLKMDKVLEKIKNFFGRKSEKKEEPKPKQEEPKAQGKSKEQK